MTDTKKQLPTQMDLFEADTYAEADREVLYELVAQRLEQVVVLLEADRKLHAERVRLHTIEDTPYQLTVLRLVDALASVGLDLVVEEAQ